MSSFKPTHTFPFKLMAAVATIAVVCETLLALGHSVRGNELTLTQIAEAVEQDQVKWISVEGDRLWVTFDDDRQAEVRQTTGQSAIAALTALNVPLAKIQAVSWSTTAPSVFGPFLQSLIIMLPVVILLGLVVTVGVYALRAFAHRSS